jgi:hypothetical protein
VSVRAEAPTLSRASVRAIGVAAIRLALGVAFVVAATLRGLDGGPTAISAIAGALVLTMIALGQRSRAGAADLGDALPVPADARFDPGWIGVLLACIPSTIGVSVLAVLALVFSAALGAVLAGVLIALGVLAVVSWIQVTARERQDRARYWVERGPSPRLFVTRR